MSLMNQFAVEAAATDTVNNPAVTAPDNLDTGRVLSLLGLAEPETTDFLHITFEKDECEAVVAVRDGVEHRYCKQQRELELTVTNPRGGWYGFRCKATIVYFVRNGAVVGQTAILPRISRQNEADALTNWGLVEVVRDTIKFF